MVDNSREVRKAIFDVLGCIAAIITVLTYLVLCINAQWPFMDDGSFVLKVLMVMKTYAPLVVVGLVGIEYVADKNIVFRILVYAMIALVVIFMFFPSTWESVVGVVENAKEIVEQNS